MIKVLVGWIESLFQEVVGRLLDDAKTECTLDRAGRILDQDATMLAEDAHFYALEESDVISAGLNPPNEAAEKH